MWLAWGSSKRAIYSGSREVPWIRTGCNSWIKLPQGGPCEQLGFDNSIYRGEITPVTLPKTNMRIHNPRFEDVFLIENGDFLLSC